MEQAEILRRTEVHIRSRFLGEASGHDWWHVERVRATALLLAKEEGADPYVVELAALLHDIADHKFHGGDAGAGPRAARAWLEQAGADARTVALVCRIVEGVSFKGAGVPTPMDTIEGKVVQDADRLDAIGAVGIARAFAYGGANARTMHDPGAPPGAHDSFEAYRSARGTTVNHFHEKLLLLKDRMLTASGRRMAEERHAFMVHFLGRFEEEWAGRR
jgi:uncharacterized protein